MSAEGCHSIVLVPFLDHIDPRCEQALQSLERLGHIIRRVQGYSAIDLGRSILASQALADGFDEILWIDSDIVFDPADVEKLRRRELGYVCGLYPKKRAKGFACQFLPGTTAVPFGKAGGLHEVRYAGLGFTLTRRAVYDAIRTKFQLPECNRRFGTPFHPYFQPMTIPDGDGHWYLTEDYSFGERARQAGISLFADTTIRLLHIGTHAYSWDDVGR